MLLKQSREIKKDDRAIRSFGDLLSKALTALVSMLFYHFYPELLLSPEIKSMNKYLKYIKI